MWDCLFKQKHIPINNLVVHKVCLWWLVLVLKINSHVEIFFSNIYIFFYLLKVYQTVTVLFCLFYFGKWIILKNKFWVNFYFRTTKQGCCLYREQRLTEWMTFPGSQVKPTCAFQREDKLKQCGPCNNNNNHVLNPKLVFVCVFLLCCLHL